MTTATTDVCGTLNKLIETCKDGEQGFQAASRTVSDMRLKTELLQYGRQCEEFADELRSALTLIGGEPAEHGTIGGMLHRGWMSVRQAVAGNDTNAILAECERGEDSAVSAYREAMESMLPPSVAGIVETQYQEVERVHNRIRALRETAKQN